MMSTQAGSTSSPPSSSMRVTIGTEHLVLDTKTTCKTTMTTSCRDHDDYDGGSDDDDNDGLRKFLRKRTPSTDYEGADESLHVNQHSAIHTDAEWYNNAFANLRVLKITALSFFLFVVAEVIGAFISNSLSLLGDASAMSMDVSTYVISIFVGLCFFTCIHTYIFMCRLIHVIFSNTEEFKLRNKGAKLSVDTMWLVDVGKWKYPSHTYI